MPLRTEFCKYFKSVLLSTLRHRFYYLFTDKIFLASTFKNFSYRKFEFLKDLNERTKLLKEAQDFVYAFYNKHLKEEEDIQNNSISSLGLCSGLGHSASSIFPPNEDITNRHQQITSSSTPICIEKRMDKSRRSDENAIFFGISGQRCKDCCYVK